METRARYALIGLFTIAVVLAGFAFVYWIQNTGGLGQRTNYRVRFEGSVSGLLVGSNVLFNGTRVGEVTALQLDPANPRIVMATIAVDPSAPVKTDTAVGMDFQGLTGAPVVVLNGGSPDAASPKSSDGLPPLLDAGPNAGQTLTQSATSTLRRVDAIISENAKPLQKTMENVSTFTEVLSRNSNRIDGILAGLERMTGGAGGGATPIYTFTVPADLQSCAEAADLQIVIPEPGALIGFSTNKFPVQGVLAEPRALDKAQLADTVPALVHAKTVEALENSRCFRSVTRNIDGVQSDIRLALDIRNFTISTDPRPVADLDLSVKAIADGGKIIATTIFHETSPLQAVNAASATAALNDAFAKMIRKLTPWLVEAAAKFEKPPPEPKLPP